MGRQRGGGPPGQATLLPGVGGGTFPITASFTNPRSGWSPPHARAHTRARPAKASWGCGWPLGGDGPAASLRLAPPHPSRPARRSPQRALPS